MHKAEDDMRHVYGRERNSGGSFEAAIDQLLANCIFTQMAEVVTANLRKMSADGNTDILPDLMAKAYAARTFFENAAYSLLEI